MLRMRQEFIKIKLSPRKWKSFSLSAVQAVFFEKKQKKNSIEFFFNSLLVCKHTKQTIYSTNNETHFISLV